MSNELVRPVLSQLRAIAHNSRYREETRWEALAQIEDEVLKLKELIAPQRFQSGTASATTCKNEG